MIIRKITQLNFVVIWFFIVIIDVTTSQAMSNGTTQSIMTTTSTPLAPLIIAPQQIELPGQHFALSTGVMYVPPYFHAKKKNVNLLIHFHGASWVVEQSFYPTGKNAVVVTIPLRGLSGVYTAKYKDKKEFGRLLTEIMETLDKNSIVHRPRLGRLCLTSFSAGFGAMREILQVPAYYKKITDTVFLDSIHAGLDTTTHTPPAEQMQMFLQFAQDAVRGKKTMWITHSQIDPKTYASTTKTADFLIKKLGLQRVVKHEDTSSLSLDEPWKTMRLLSTVDQGNFHVREFAGETGQDHMNHFYTMGKYIAQTSLPSILDK
ncbi:MAG: hypothetical protein N3A72_04215 [bacterium]|nr:hypothetical protein [bacterium]